MHGVCGRPHVRVVQRIVRAVAVACVSIQGCGVKGRERPLAGDDGDDRRIERKRCLFWGRRSDKRLGEEVFSRVADERGA